MRLPEADPAQSPALQEAYAGFRSTRGIVSNIMRSFGHAPAGLNLIATLGRYCRYETDLTELQKELVILITGRGVDYAWHHHAPLGVQAGLTEGQLDALREGRTPEGLGETEAALCDYVRAYASLKGVPDAVFARLAARLTPRQLTDVNIISGYFLMIASCIIGMQVQIDPPQVLDAAADHHKSSRGGAR